MIPSNLDIELYNGATYTFQLTVESGDAPVDMSGYDAIELDLFKPYSATALLTIDAVISGAGSNILTFTVTAVQAAALLAIKHRYQLKLTEGSEVFVWLKGDANVLNVYKEGASSTTGTVNVTTSSGAVITLEVDGAVDIAVAAKIAAQAAQAGAETAQGLAEDARDAAALSASGASDSASAASASASSASGSASAASASAASATTAQGLAEDARDAAQGYANDAANSATWEIELADVMARVQELGAPLVVPVLDDANVPTPPANVLYLFADSSNSNAVSVKDSSGTVTTL